MTRPGLNAATRTVDPDNRLVARGLEADWEKTLAALAAAEAELTRREKRCPAALSASERAMVLALGDDLNGIWAAPTTTDKDRKQLLHTLLDEVIITITADDAGRRAELQIRWRRRDQRTNSSAQTSPAKDPHRGRHDRVDPPPGPPPRRRGHRRDTQPARPAHRPRPVIHRQ